MLFFVRSNHGVDMSDKEKSYSRREFLSGSASLATKAMVVASLAKVNDVRAAAHNLDEGTDFTSEENQSLSISHEEQHQVVVVGTGFGGGVAALRLGEAGIKTLVLERGKEWPITSKFDTFPSFKKPDNRCRWMGRTPALPLAPIRIFKKGPGLLEKIKGPDLDIVVGAGVGGSSLTFGGVMARPPEDLFEQVFSKEIPYAEMENTYYPRVKSVMGFSPMPDDIFNSPNYKVARIFEKHAEKCGYEVSRLDSVYDWDSVRKELDGSLPKSTTIGQYMYGVNNGAKLSVDRNYIKKAKETGNVELRSLHAVQKIGQSSDGKFWLEVARLDLEGKIVERIKIYTDKLILSAGSMWTSRLLLQARENKLLPNLNSHIGLHWCNNAEKVFMRALLPESTLTNQGGPPSVGTMFQRTPSGPISLEIASAPLPLELGIMMIAIIGMPNSLGKFVYNHRSGKVVLRCPPETYADAENCAKVVLKEWNKKNGGGILIDFDKLSPRPVSFHPLGGAVLGKACDYYGRLEGYKGLYAMDSSLIPGSAGCANPAWTVAAISERCIENIIENDF